MLKVVRKQTDGKFGDFVRVPRRGSGGLERHGNCAIADRADLERLLSGGAICDAERAIVRGNGHKLCSDYRYMNFAKRLSALGVGDLSGQVGGVGERASKQKT